MFSDTVILDMQKTPSNFLEPVVFLVAAVFLCWVLTLA